MEGMDTGVSEEHKADRQTGNIAEVRSIQVQEASSQIERDGAFELSRER